MDVSRAACRAAPTELFFTADPEEIPDLSKRKRVNDARSYSALKLCAGCPIKRDCLEENLTAPFGIFGGKGRVHRGAIARARGLSFGLGPNIDEVVVDRLTQGEEVESNKLERHQASLVLIRLGYNNTEIAERLACSRANIYSIRSAEAA